MEVAKIMVATAYVFSFFYKPFNLMLYFGWFLFPISYTVAFKYYMMILMIGIILNVKREKIEEGIPENQRAWVLIWTNLLITAVGYLVYLCLGA